MGDIKLNNIEEAKLSATKYPSKVIGIDSEEKLCFVIIVFMQLINCILYKVEGDTTRLTIKNINSMCKSNRIKCLFRFRNVMCHLYDTEEYVERVNQVIILFGENYYSTILLFIKEVVSSINDNTFIEKYGVPEKDKFNSLKSFT